MKNYLRYLNGYPAEMIQRVESMLPTGKLKANLEKRYLSKNSSKHQIQSDKALYTYVNELKREYVKRGAPIAKIQFDKKQDIEGALGIHYTKPRVQGNKLKSKVEIRISDIFKSVPEDFLRMVVVHEIAHLNEKNHDKAFYRLCTNMESDYHQLEFDFRLWMVVQEYNAINQAKS